MNLNKIFIGATLVFSSITSLFAGMEAQYPLGQCVPASFVINNSTFTPAAGYRGSIVGAPYINFTATCQGKLTASSPYTTIPFYPSWVPPVPSGYPTGSRPYATIQVTNGTTTAMPFIISGQESPWVHPSLAHCDNMIWYKNSQTQQWTFLDDDHSQNGSSTRQFGALITLSAYSSIEFRVSMYNPNETGERFFSVALFPGDAAAQEIYVLPGFPSIFQ